jgi:osmotically-inducible protein OsmY
MAEDNLVNDVEQALNNDVRINSTMIKVNSDEPGVVTLEGRVDTFAEKDLAEQIAGRVRGAKDVRDRLTVVPATPRSDEEITQNVRRNLELDTWVEHTKIDVETMDSVVFLRGTVSTMMEKMEAENDALWVAGVIDTINHINVKPVMKVEDAEIERDIRAALLKNTRLDLTEMNIDVTDGIATLTGGVANFTQKRIAEFVAFAVPGVVDVVNELYIIGLMRKAA